MKKAIFAGTFDPFSIGHYNVTVSASKIFDEVVVAVAEKSKSGVSLQERMKIAERSICSVNNASVAGFSGLLTDFIKNSGSTFLVRGLRNSIDLEYEKDLQRLYKQMMPELEICYIVAEGDYDYVSSSRIRELLSFNASVDAYTIREAHALIQKNYGAGKY